MENFEFVGVAMRKIVYLRHALMELRSKTSFRNVIKFHWQIFHKKFGFSIKILTKSSLEVDDWRKNPQPGLMFNYAKTISTFLHPNEFFWKEYELIEYFSLKKKFN
jgi:hypothetical protein